MPAIPELGATSEPLGNLLDAIARATATLTILEAIEDPNAPMVHAALARWQA